MHKNCLYILVSSQCVWVQNWNKGILKLSCAQFLFKSKFFTSHAKFHLMPSTDTTLPGNFYKNYV